MILTTVLLLLTCSYITHGVEADDSLTGFFRLTLEKWRFNMHHGFQNELKNVVPRLAPFYYEQVLKERYA